MASTNTTKEALIKSMRNLKSHRTRVLGRLPPSESHMSLLEKLGFLWDDFSLKYDEFEEVLDGMEDQAAKKLRDKFVTQKSLQEYYKEAENVYGEAETRLTKLVEDDFEKKNKQDIFRVELPSMV